VLTADANRESSTGSSEVKGRAARFCHQCIIDNAHPSPPD
jgi:hypothetical protein